MSGSELQGMFRFNAWSTERLLKTTGELSQQQFVDVPGPGHVEIKRTLFHLMRGMRLWRLRSEGGGTMQPLAEEDYGTLDAIRGLWQIENEAIQKHVGSLSDAQLAETVNWQNPGSDVVNTGQRWEILFGMIAHGMQHRSEVAQSLTCLGHSPGELGVVYYLVQGRK